GSWCPPRLFFFQAEDGIRDFHVTGVQTCALPILPRGDVGRGTCCALWAAVSDALLARHAGARREQTACLAKSFAVRRSPCAGKRSEERRVGKGGRSRWAAGRYGQQTGGRPPTSAP